VPSFCEFGTPSWVVLLTISKGENLKFLTWLVRIALFLVVLSFAVRNTDAVVVSWLPGLQAELPLVMALLVAFLAGLLMAWLILLPSWLKARRAAAIASKALAKAEKEKPLPPAAQTQSELSSVALSVGPTHGI
jgi:uncharacterized integral membrane protein